METKKVWFVTGASKGLGLALVNKLLSAGYPVAATSRNAQSLHDAVGNPDTSIFLPLQTDLSSEPSIQEAIDATIARFGRIDVVVNNAGYGIGGTVEELSTKEVADSFGINVFATISVIKAVMPVLRRQRSGHVINISSIAGFAAATGWGMYAATKYAVMGLSEVLAEDVRSLGIKVTVVAPGAFRTEFLSEGSLAFSENKIDEYETVRQSHARYLAMNGSQAGSPEKAATAFIELAENPDPPVRLYLGTDAYQRASAKIETLKSELEKNKNISFSTDY